MHAKIINNKFYLGSLSFSLFDFSDVMDALDLSCSDRFIFRGWATMFPARNSSNVRCTSCIHKNAYSRKVARKLWSKNINISHYTTEVERQTEDTRQYTPMNLLCIQKHFVPPLLWFASPMSGSLDLRQWLLCSSRMTEKFESSD